MKWTSLIDNLGSNRKVLVCWKAEATRNAHSLFLFPPDTRPLFFCSFVSGSSIKWIVVAEGSLSSFPSFRSFTFQISRLPLGFDKLYPLLISQSVAFHFYHVLKAFMSPVHISTIQCRRFNLRPETLTTQSFLGLHWPPHSFYFFFWLAFFSLGNFFFLSHWHLLNFYMSFAFFSNSFFLSFFLSFDTFFFPTFHTLSLSIFLSIFVFSFFYAYFLSFSLNFSFYLFYFLF